MQAKLGLREQPTDRFGLDFEAIASGEKQSVVASFRQIYYTASVGEPTTPSNFFAPALQETSSMPTKVKAAFTPCMRA